MNRIEKILMKRDGITAEEAREIWEDALAEAREVLESGDGSLGELEEISYSYFGLEADYAEDLLYSLM